MLIDDSSITTVEDFSDATDSMLGPAQSNHPGTERKMDPVQQSLDSLSTIFTKAAFEELEVQGALADGMVSHQELLAVADTDGIEGLSQAEARAVMSGLNEQPFDLSSAQHSILGVLTEQVVSRLEHLGALKDGKLTPDELFQAQDFDGNGQITLEEHQASIKNQRQWLAESGFEHSKALIDIGDQLNVFEDGQISPKEWQAMEAYYEESVSDQGPENLDTSTPGENAVAIEHLKDHIKETLDSGDCYHFSFNDKDYYLEKNSENGKYQAYTQSGTLIDDTVQIDTDYTVEGFVEVGGLAGLKDGERLYIGTTPDGVNTMITYSAELDANDAVGPEGSHLETLLQKGTVIQPVGIIASPNPPTPTPEIIDEARLEEARKYFGDEVASAELKDAVTTGNSTQVSYDYFDEAGNLLGSSVALTQHPLGPDGIDPDTTTTTITFYDAEGNVLTGLNQPTPESPPAEDASYVEQLRDSAQALMALVADASLQAQQQLQTFGDIIHESSQRLDQSIFIDKNQDELIAAMGVAALAQFSAELIEARVERDLELLEGYEALILDASEEHGGISEGILSLTEGDIKTVIDDADALFYSIIEASPLLQEALELLSIEF